MRHLPNADLPARRARKVFLFEALTYISDIRPKTDLECFYPVFAGLYEVDVAKMYFERVRQLPTVDRFFSTSHISSLLSGRSPCAPRIVFS